MRCRTQVTTSVLPPRPSLKTKKVRTLTYLKQHDEAAEIAKELFVSDGRKEDLGEFYSDVLAYTSGNEEHDGAFRQLTRQFGNNTRIASKYASFACA